MRRNREHKDKVFIMAFQRPEDLLDLYNGLNRSRSRNILYFTMVCGRNRTGRNCCFQTHL